MVQSPPGGIRPECAAVFDIKLITGPVRIGCSRDLAQGADHHPIIALTSGYAGDPLLMLMVIVGHSYGHAVPVPAGPMRSGRP